jgi:hypothetical protein
MYSLAAGLFLPAEPTQSVQYSVISAVLYVKYMYVLGIQHCAYSTVLYCTGWILLLLDWVLLCGGVEQWWVESDRTSCCSCTYSATQCDTHNTAAGAAAIILLMDHDSACSEVGCMDHDWRVRR